MTGAGSIGIVHACLRGGRGGSPTAVLDEAALSDRERRRIPGLAGVSHAVFVAPAGQQGGIPTVRLRFFTAAGELPACGHGTVAALALLAQRAGSAQYRATLQAAGRVFAGRAARTGDGWTAVFDPGPVQLRDPLPGEVEPVLDAIGLTGGAVGACVASVGRPRLLVPVANRTVLAGLVPDSERLGAVTAELGLLGCYAYSVPARGRAAARMFAPAIGVPEDIANANSSACLAARVLPDGVRRLRVDMGDSLGQPATVVTTARPTRAGVLVDVGGTAVVTRL